MTMNPGEKREDFEKIAALERQAALDEWDAAGAEILAQQQKKQQKKQERRRSLSRLLW
jgi:hypothetical protein